MILQLRKIFIGAVRLACYLNFRSLVVRVMWDDIINVSTEDSDNLCIISDVLCEPHSQLRIVHHNVQGLQSKWDDLSDWMAGSASSGSVFCFSETWVKPESVLLHMPGFQTLYSPFLLCPGSQKKYLPGSCLFVSDFLNPEHPPICGEIEESLTFLNASCCFVSCSRWRLAVVCLYRSPSICVSVGLGDLCQLLSKLSLCSRHIVLAGDLNINLMNDCSATANYQNIPSDFQLTQFVPG